jgi:RHS repeat-associated protein
MTTRYFVLAWMATTLTCLAQQLGVTKLSDNPLLVPPSVAGQTAPARQTSQALLAVQPLSAPIVPSSPIAESVTPDIQALARGLENDPVRIFNYVHDHINHVLYFGSKKGAELTLLEKSGNDFDQAALLVALLRSSGYTNVGYQFGWMEMPYDSPDHRDLHHWLQSSLVNTNWGYTSNYLYYLVQNYRHYPATAAIWGTNVFGFQRVWVTLTNGASVYYLDPAFKVSEPISGINLPTALGFSSNSLMSAAGGTYTPDYVFGLNESGLRSTLTSYTTNLLNYIQSNCPNASVAQILGGWQIVPATNTTLSQTLPFTTYTWGGQMPVLSWANEPTDMMATLSISFNSGIDSYQWFMPQLQGQRLTLTFNTSGLATLWQEDTALLQDVAYYEPSPVTISVGVPHGYWDTNNNAFVDTGSGDSSSTRNFESLGSTNVIFYGFEPDWGRLQQRQDKLDAYRLQGVSDSSLPVVSETMNVMGLNYILENWSIEKIMATQMGVLPQTHYNFGRLDQEKGAGYYFDMFMSYASPAPSAGFDAANNALVTRFAESSGYFGSGLEHGVIEQLQFTNYVAASTVKMLEIAITNGEAVFLATPYNWWAGVRDFVAPNYSSSDLDTFDYLISNGDGLLLPQYGYNWVGEGTWYGYGFVDYRQPGSASWYIYGQYFGGVVSNPEAGLSPGGVSHAGDQQPRRNPLLPDQTSADPVTMETGAFRVSHVDLSLGGAEPRGISLSRQYASNGRLYSTAGMGPGWANNYSMNAQSVAAPAAGLGRTTPAQMAPILAATAATIGIYDNSLDTAKNWTVTTLIAKWAVDQLTRNGVSVQLGDRTVQFVQQPDRRFTPPASCTMTLGQNGGAYSLVARHGNTFNFDELGRLTNIVDQYSQPLTLAYNSSNWVQTVTDWKNRSLTFNYSGPHLVSVSDSAGRSIYYGYNASGDLIAFTDPESKTWTYSYDTNHHLTATFDPSGQLVVTNFYDGFGRVTTQYIQGDTNKAWQIYWTDWQTVLQDPAGGKKRYLYDDNKRQTGYQDALGNLGQSVYDGQDHVTMAISPMNETNLFVYDGNQNLITSVDALSFTNRFVYDSLLNLIGSVDARGNTSSFGYNAQFSLIGQTNGAGNFIAFSFNSDGTLGSRTDVAGTTLYGYDGYGLLNSITYPAGLGSESFVNNSLGDATSRTSPRGFVSSFQYDNRRQLTNMIAPSNLTFSVTFTAAGNVASTTDARGNTISNTWSTTSKLLSMKLPGTPQGSPVVSTLYDNRDWAYQTSDPLQRVTQYTNDISGQLVAVTDPLRRATSFGYDADGRRLAAANAANETNSQTWDARGSLLRLTDGAGHFSTRAYDAVGNQITLTNRNGKTWQFQFDGANRLTNTVTPLNRRMAQNYDSRGFLATMKDPAGQTTSYNYDAKGRLTNRTDNVGTTLYGYDASDNRTSAVENGQTNTWTFDAYNRVSSYQDTFGNLLQYRYDANGNLTNLVYPGGRNVYYAYDSLNRLTNVTDWAGRRTTLAYDLAGQLTSVTHPNGTLRLLNYDAAGQLTNIVEKTGANLPVAFCTLNWNANATAQWEFAAPLPHSSAPATRTMTYDDDNRLATLNGTAVNNDSDGNLTYAPLTNGTFVTQTFDARNRLITVGGPSATTNIYDTLNNRIGQIQGTNTTSWVIDPNAGLSQALVRIKNGVTTYYVYGPGLLYQVTEGGGTTNTLTYHYDYRGSTIALSDDSGNVSDRMEYSLYATLTYRVGTNDTPFLFNGRYGVQTDANGLLYMRARYYNPYLCRFINADPVGFGGGLNWYAYGNGNPVSLVDPFGLDAYDSNPVSDFAAGILYGLWGAVSGIAKGGLYAATHGEETIDAAFSAAFHPVRTTEAVAQGVENTFADFGTGLGSGNYECAGKAFFGIAAMTASALKLAELGEAGNLLRTAEATAAKGGVLADANFAQKTFSQAFSSEGAFAGRTVDDVAAALRSGQMGAADVPVQYIIRDGNTLMLNTRSAQALEAAGIPRAQWNAVNMTGDAAAEARLTGQLQRNGLGSQGTPTVTPGRR